MGTRIGLWILQRIVMPVTARFTRRRALSLVWGLGASSLLAACDQAGAVAPASPTQSPTQQAPAPSPTPNADQDALLAEPLPRPFDGIRIEFWFPRLGPNEKEAFQAEVAKFKALTGMVIWPDFSDWGQRNTRSKRGFGAQSAPDISWGGSLWLPWQAASGWALELDDYVASWDDWDDFYPMVREDVTYEGNVYGIPFRTDYRGSVVFRPSLFEAAGLPPEPPSTWEELNEIAPRLTIRDGENFTQAGFDLHHAHTQVYEDWLAQAGGSPFNADLTRPTNDTPQGHIALSQHVRFGLVDETMPVKSMDSGVPNVPDFCAGNVAIQQLWPGNVGNCETNGPEVFADLAVGPPFQGPSQRAMQLYVNTYMAWKLTQHPDAAFETIKYFSSPGPNYEIHFIADRYMPCRTAMEDYDLYATDPWKTFASNGNYAQFRQVVTEHFDIQPAMSSWVEKAALGELSVDEALEGMDAEVLEYMSGS